MFLQNYLKKYNSSIYQVHLNSKISEATLISLNKRDLRKWNLNYFDAIANTIHKNRYEVMSELEKFQSEFIESTNNNFNLGKYNLENRRYIGNKNKLLPWITGLIDEHTNGNSFFDVFAGTGVVSKEVLRNYNKIILNDFLFSNNVIYSAFFGTAEYDIEKLKRIQKKYNKIRNRSLDDEYFQSHYGGSFFSERDAGIIGEIRTNIEMDKGLTPRERDILIASLLYSSDKIANTVGHYDAYRKVDLIQDRFIFDLINPLNTTSKEIEIYREDANNLVKKVQADIAFIDPPYNSRQYSRFYHVLENLTKWNKPSLEGIAKKPPSENTSEFCKTNAPVVFSNLINDLNVNYIVVTYNNTYKSKSKSSRNKITHEQILKSLSNVGETIIFETPYKFFNSGKTDLTGHKESLFITKVFKK